MPLVLASVGGECMRRCQISASSRRSGLGRRVFWGRQDRAVGTAEVKWASRRGFIPKPEGEPSSGNPEGVEAVLVPQEQDLESSSLESSSDAPEP